MSPQRSWSVLTIGLVLAFAGTVALISIIRSWELTLRRDLAAEGAKEGAGSWPEEAKITPLTPDPYASQNLSEYATEIEQLRSTLLTERNKHNAVTEDCLTLRQQMESIQRDHRTGRESDFRQRQEYDGIVTEYKNTIVEQRESLEQRQEQVNKLESRVNDLQYEVKTLLQLGELGQHQAGALPSHPVLDLFTEGERAGAALSEEGTSAAQGGIASVYDATQQLRQCLDIASGIQGAAHLFQGSGGLEGLNPNSSAIDIRRLSDSFRSQADAVVILYSPKEERPLFVNPLIKGLTGWRPEKFCADFMQLIQQGWSEWRHATLNLNEGKQEQVSLVIKTRSGHDIMAESTIGLVTAGVFQGQILAVLYAA